MLRGRQKKMILEIMMSGRRLLQKSPKCLNQVATEKDSGQGGSEDEGLA